MAVVIEEEPGVKVLAVLVPVELGPTILLAVT